MRCVSTAGRCLETDLAEALYTGLAPDGSLYMPRRIEPLDDRTLRGLAALPLAESATIVAQHLLEDCLEPDAIRALVHDTLDFPVPLVGVEDGRWVLELFHGPTLAFKDVGARFMARLMRALDPPAADEPLTILVATSGDTGSAVAHAFAGVPGFEVAVLFPAGQVSVAQQKLFTTLGGNVRSFAVEGTFDDCQRMVKECFADADLRAKKPLGSANSINLGRLLPQSFYYLHLLHELTAQGLDPWSIDLRIVTPSGNFGNLTAGLFARRLGLPCRFVAATNANDVVPQFLDGRPYQPRPSVSTLSNAMDVGTPSNFDRILHLYGGDEDALRADLLGVSVDDQQTLRTIGEVYRRTGYVLDPHTAVGYLALEQAVPAQATGVVLATAHPAKFADVVEKATGEPVILPPALAECLDRPEFVTALAPAAESLRDALLASGEPG